MNKKRHAVLIGLIVLAASLSACRAAKQTASTPTPSRDSLPVTQTPTTPLQSSETKALLWTEAIQVFEPGPGAHVRSPIHISGEVSPVMENNLIVRALAADGTVLADQLVNLDSGIFRIEFAVKTQEDQPLFIQVFHSDPAPVEVTHLASVVVFLTESGALVNKPVLPQEEQIQILSPLPGETISGGELILDGYGWASFEQTLVVELFDAQGNLLAQEPVLVQSPGMGQPGPFRATLSYTLAAACPGKLVVRDPGAAFDGDVHLSSVDVLLVP